MTTAVTIDAHAGWDVEVTTKTEVPVPAGLERMGPVEYNEATFIVKAGQKHTEYVWAGKTISNIREIPK